MLTRSRRYPTEPYIKRSKRSALGCVQSQASYQQALEFSFSLTIAWVCTRLSSGSVCASNNSRPACRGLLEWLIADLALAHFSVPTVTLTSSVLLTQILEAHPPNAIIVDASFLERVLELLAESLNDVVVVVVNDKKGELKRLKGKTSTRLVPWEDLESFEGAGPSVAQPGQ